ncbi:MAG: ParB/RepB/Spo0J family partition protein [Desulfobacterales bacterium]|nr:ParB/RepB/Spo0J family partition protein [Desulfobacterales bacterium]
MPTQKSSRDAKPASRKRKKMALGKGLDALIPSFEGVGDEDQDYFFCKIDLIHPNRYQPRAHFAAAELRELAESIQAQGILQPLLVRKDNIGYELVAGERRLRAAKMIGLQKVPVLLKDISDTALLEMSIIENIQREDLNPIEEADAYHRLMSEFKLTQDQVAERVGKSRPTVANFLRLRQLPDHIKASIVDGRLSMGHARALLGVDAKAQLEAAWRKVITKGLSVRETENLIRTLKSDRPKPPAPRPVKSSDDIYFADLESNLARHFGTKIRIKRHGKRGKIEIDFYSNDDLKRLIDMLQS